MNSYCASLTDSQAQNVLETEKDRMRRHRKGTSVWNEAHKLVLDAQNVLSKRGLLY